MPGWRLKPKRPGAKPSVEIPTAIGAKLELRHHKKDILYEMSKAEIQKLWGYPTTENLRLRPFFRNVIWQFYEQIQAGHPPDFVLKRGFIRGMWYPIKTPMSRHRFAQLKVDRSDTMGKALSDLVEDGLCRYKDFQFTDDNQNARVIGEGNAHIILVTEKEGFFGMLRGASERYGCTVLATGGMGTFLSTNYMVSEMEDQGVDLAKTEFAVLTINDFDPTGFNIGEEFLRDLESCGVRRFRTFAQYGRKDYRWLDLVQRSTLEPGESINDHTYLIHKRFRKQPEDGSDPWAKTWARTTGGVDGKGGLGKKWELGIQADEFREVYLNQLVERHIQPLLTVPAAVVQRRLQMRALEKEVGRYLIYRMTTMG